MHDKNGGVMKNLRLALLLSVLCCDAFAQSGNSLDAARQAMASGNPVRAIELLQPLETEHAGEPAYDYLLGLARLDAGDPERAVFAFERVLAMKPDHLQARAEIGRAYLLLGEKEAGIRELKTVGNGQIPDEARKTIEDYLSAFGAGPTRFSGYLESSFGYDSNINSAVAASHLAIPGIGTFALSEDGRSHSAFYMGLAGGINVSHPINENWSLLGGASINQRFNNNYGRYDTGGLEGNVGLRYGTGQHAFTLGLQAQSFEVDHTRNREALGLIGQWQYLVDAKTQVSLFGQHIQLRYPFQSSRDADRSIAGFAFAKVLEGAWTPSWFASIYAGEERETHANVAHLGHQPVGFRFGGQVKPSSTTTWFANAAYENRRYGGSDPLFLVRRHDKQLDVRAGMNYEPARFWVVSPQVSYTRNDSNVALNDYSRNMVSLTVRREF